MRPKTEQRVQVRLIVLAVSQQSIKQRLPGAWRGHCK